MKTKICGFILFPLFLLLYAGCDKLGDPLGGDAKIEADINGSHWSSSSTMTYYMEAAEPVGTTMIGQSLTDFKEFILHWPGVLEEGTWSLMDGSSDYYITWAEPTISYTSVSGTLTITEIDGDKKVSGTFSFQGREDDGTATITVTNGKFSNVKKQLK